MLEPDRDISREQLLLFQALWTKRSLTDAAAVLGIHVPKASRILKSLREVFGDELFVRVGSAMEPTRQAQSIWPQVEESLIALDKLMHPQTFDPKRLRKTFSVIVFDQPLSRFGPVLVDALSQAAPQCRVVFLAPGSDWQDMLSDGRADVAISPVGNIKSGFMQLAASHCSYSITLRPGHPLLSKKNVTAADLRDYPECIVMASRLRGRQFYQDSTSPDKFVVVPDALAAPVFLLKTDAWMVACTLTSEQMFKAYFHLETIPFPPDFRPFAEQPTIKIVWHNRYSSDPAQQWFRGVLANSIKSVCGKSPRVNPMTWTPLSARGRGDAA